MKSLLPLLISIFVALAILYSQPQTSSVRAHIAHLERRAESLCAKVGPEQCEIARQQAGL